MNKTLFTLFAASLWAGAAISSAAPAHALAATSQQGTYASCSAYSAPYTLDVCGYIMNYRQNLKFNTTACASGSACSSDSSLTYVQFLYSTGRKIATPRGGCGMYFYDLGTCSC